MRAHGTDNTDDNDIISRVHCIMKPRVIAVQAKSESTNHLIRDGKSLSRRRAITNGRIIHTIGKFVEVHLSCYHFAARVLDQEIYITTSLTQREGLTLCACVVSTDRAMCHTVGGSASLPDPMRLSIIQAHGRDGSDDVCDGETGGLAHSDVFEVVWTTVVVFEPVFALGESAGDAVLALGRVRTIEEWDVLVADVSEPRVG